MANRSLNVQAAQTVGLDVRLEIGDNVSVVEVSAEAVQLQTEAPVRGGNINSSAALNLPFYGRNPAMLAITLPGVNERRQNTAGTATFSVNGARGRSNNFLLDGTENNDISVAGQAFQIKNPGRGAGSIHTDGELRCGVRACRRRGCQHDHQVRNERLPWIGRLRP